MVSARLLGLLSILFVRFRFAGAHSSGRGVLSILFVRFPVHAWVYRVTVNSFNSLCEILYYTLVTKMVEEENFQFSL